MCKLALLRTICTSVDYVYSETNIILAASFFLCILPFMLVINKTHQTFVYLHHNHSVKVIICFLSSAGYFILKTAGVFSRNTPFRCTGGCGCCCNPQDAEQNLSWDFTPPSPISSFPHFLILSSPHHLPFHLISADTLECILHFQW